MDGNAQMTSITQSNNDFVHELDNITQQLCDTIKSMHENGLSHGELVQSITYTWLLCKTIQSQQNAIDSWLLDMIAMELDNMYDESMEHTKKVMKSIDKYMKWVNTLKIM